MRVINLLVFAAILIVLAGCKQKSQISDSIDSKIDEIKQSAAAVTDKETLQEAGNVTAQIVESVTQTVFVPLPQQSISSNDIVSRNYQSSCLVKKYSVLNIYCSFKNFWHNQNSLISWYVPYSFVLLLLVVVLIIIWWVTRNK